MTYTASITSQGQVNIPIDIRRALRLDKMRKVTLTLQGDAVMMKPIKDLASLMGMLHTKKRFTRKQEREAFENALAHGEA